MACASKHSTWETEAGGWEFKVVQLSLHSKGKDSLGYILALLSVQSSFVLLTLKVSKVQTSSSSFCRILPLLGLTQTLVLWWTLLALDLTPEGSLWEAFPHL